MVKTVKESSTYRYELQAHTAEWLGPPCRRAETVRLYHRAGYDSLVITDHDFALLFSRSAEELRGFDRRLRGPHAARNEGDLYRAGAPFSRGMALSAP